MGNVLLAHSEDHNAFIEHRSIIAQADLSIILHHVHPFMVTFILTGSMNMTRRSKVVRRSTFRDAVDTQHTRPADIICRNYVMQSRQHGSEYFHHSTVL